jgi:MGT family glycosyltransferase
MTTIAISMLPEEGHLIPSFRLARMLADQGHQVYYLGLPDFAPYVERQGFAFVPMLAQQFPAGWRQRQIKTMAESRGVRFIREASQSRFFRALCDQALAADSELRQFLRDNRPDLLIADSFLAPLALIAHALQIPAALLSININLPPDDDYPPVVTNFMPEDTPASRSRARSAWGISRLARGITGLVAGVSFDRALGRAARACGFPADRVEFAALYPRLRTSAALPELILCPREFDFPRAAPLTEGTHFVEAMVDLGRSGGDFPLERLDPGKRLIYCTLGSQSHLYPRSREFFQQVIAACAQRPGWQLVLATGEHISPDGFRQAPADAVVARWAPQPALLQRAALMINHGGLGTVKECLYFGVPMLCLPFSRDQPGYAARVAYHGLGLMGDIRRSTAARLLEQIESILSDRGYAERVGAMRAVFQTREREQPGLAVISGLLRQSAPARPTEAEPQVQGV